MKKERRNCKYLDNNKGVIPSALIVSAQPCAKLEYDKTSRKLVLDREKNSLLVLDGQHRLFGMKYAQKEYEIPVVVFSELTTQEEIRQFIDINTTQKGVPTALILDIKGPAGTESKIEERQRKLFDSLNKDSVVAGLMLSNEVRRGKFLEQHSIVPQKLFLNLALSVVSQMKRYIEQLKTTWKL